MQLNPYLVFNGNCKDAFAFYAGVFGGTPQVMTNGDSPMGSEIPAEAKELVMHASLDLGGGYALLGSDNQPGVTETPQGFAVTLNFEAADEAERTFDALSDGGTVTMPIQETFWATRFGMLTDQFGMPWMVNCARPMGA